MILGEHEAAQFRSKMPGDAGRQWRCHGCAVRRLPALATEIHDMRTDHQVLHHKIRVPFEARPLRRSCDLTVRSSWIDSFDVLLPFRRVSPPAVRGVFGSVALSIPLGLMFGRPGPPLRRVISSRCAATVRRSSATSSNSFSTKLFKSPGEKSSRSAGGTIPTRKFNSCIPGNLIIIPPPRLLPLLLPIRNYGDVFLAEDQATRRSGFALSLASRS